MSVAEYYDKLAKDYHKQYEKTDEYPANLIRLGIVLDILRNIGAEYVWEFGIGEGTPAVAMAKAGVKVIGGCDISAEMVALAKENFKKNGLNPELVVQGNETFHGVEMDAVVATGVLPHIEDDHALIKEIHDTLKPGGTAIVEFRNSLFSLFTFNRHTRDFILDDLLAPVHNMVREDVDKEVRRRVMMREPRKTEFDKISRFHNPFTLQEMFLNHGFENIHFHWYHYHAAPPIFGDIDGFARAESINLEGEGTWRGMFLCSAGLIEATKCWPTVES